MLLFALTRARARPLLLAAAAYTGSLGVTAAEPSPRLATANLQLLASPECTNQADLITRVRARSPRVRFVDDESGLVIVVQISGTTSGSIAAEVRLSTPGSKPSLRRVVAQTCTEAADAVALIIAVTLDPASAGQSVSSSTAKDAAVPVGGSNPAVDERANGGKPQGSSAERSAPAPVAESTTTIDHAESTNSRTRASFGVQLAAEAFVGVAPGVMPGVALFAIAGIDRPSVWSPAAVLGVRHAFRTEIQEPGGDASFTLDAATLDLCPARFRLGILEARPCGSALLGRLSARGTDTFNPAAESARPFWVVGGAVLATVKLLSLLEMSGRFAVGANLVRDSFEFDPTTFHTVPPFSASASVGIGLRWR